jgi:glycerol-3-phosphate dehydrogenase (NAD(P)+)
MKQIAVLGDGAWGTAIAHLLASNGHHVNWWCFDKSVAASVINKRVNTRFLPSIELQKRVIPMTEMGQALKNVSSICCAIPVKYMRSVFSLINPDTLPKVPWIILSKGIEEKSLLLPSQVVAHCFGNDTPCIIISGPSFAQETAMENFTGVMIAGQSKYLVHETNLLFQNDYFRLIPSDDVIGIQWCGALKNVIALSYGLVEGAEYGQNTKALVLTQGLQEIQRLVIAIGGKTETVFGLAGIGDLILTATGHLSKNVIIGKKIGSGMSLQNAIKELGTEPEGINTIKSVYQYMQKNSYSSKFWNNIYGIIYHGLSIHDFVRTLV